jgi:DNA-binding CsgD family transcriptional regulator
VAARIANAPDHRALLELLHEGARALGAPNAYFVSIAHDGTTVKSSRHLLACDPRWCRHYLNSGALAADPWLAYARVQSSPVLASALAPRDAAQRRMVALAGAHGFASALLVPAHAGTGHSRTSLLCLGSDQVGHFEADGFARARIGARILAWEMHDWWLARIREQLTQQARITPVDLALLRHQHLGHSSKRIAAELQVTQTSVNSRFQRVNHKLGVANRKLAARLACECGLIQGG